MQEKAGTGSGLTQRVMQEVMDTPALKEIILLHMWGVRPERASGLAETLLWRDPAMAMSFFGSAPAAANWLLVFLPITLYLKFGMPEAHMAIFACACLAILPLAGRIADAARKLM